MLVVVLFVPAALPWYYSWPLAVVAPLAQSRVALAAIAAFSTWIMVIFRPDGAHGMYSWLHVGLATAAAALAWYMLYRAPSRPEVAVGGSIRHSLRAAQDFACLVGVQRVNRSGIADRVAGSVSGDRQRRVGSE